MVYTEDLSPSALCVWEFESLHRHQNIYAPETYMVMYRFRKAGNFVQVEVGAPNMKNDYVLWIIVTNVVVLWITPLKHLLDDANSCKVGKLVRFQTEAPNKAAVVIWRLQLVVCET
jgi:hypothetical protein